MQTAPSLETTWQNLRGELRGFLVGQVGEPATADDLLQDVFLKLHRRGATCGRRPRPAPGSTRWRATP